MIESSSKYKKLQYDSFEQYNSNKIWGFDYQIWNEITLVIRMQIWSKWFNSNCNFILTENAFAVLFTICLTLQWSNVHNKPKVLKDETYKNNRYSSSLQNDIQNSNTINTDYMKISKHCCIMKVYVQRFDSYDYKFKLRL